MIDFFNRRKKNAVFVQHNDDESLFYISVDEVKEYLPHYSLIETEKRFEQLCRRIVDSGRLEKWKKKGYCLVQCVLEELHAEYCLNSVKYQDFIDEHGLDVKIRQGSYWKINGLLRVKRWFCSTGFIETIKIYLRIPIFLLYFCFFGE